jgi:hypothetical protein
MPSTESTVDMVAVPGPESQCESAVVRAASRCPGRDCGRAGGGQTYAVHGMGMGSAAGSSWTPHSKRPDGDDLATHLKQAAGAKRRSGFALNAGHLPAVVFAPASVAGFEAPVSTRSRGQHAAGLGWCHAAAEYPTHRYGWRIPLHVVRWHLASLRSSAQAHSPKPGKSG